MSEAQRHYTPEEERRALNRLLHDINRSGAMTTAVGRYKGINWHRRPFDEVFPYGRPSKRLWYFPLENDDYTGDHFATLGDMKAWIDSCAGHK